MSHPFQGAGVVRVRSAWEHDTECFISNWSGGNDNYFPITNSFDEDTSKWVRGGWDVVVIADKGHGQRKGAYLDFAGKTTYITFNGFDKDLTIEVVKA